MSTSPWARASRRMLQMAGVQQIERAVERDDPLAHFAQRRGQFGQLIAIERGRIARPIASARAG